MARHAGYLYGGTVTVPVLLTHSLSLPELDGTRTPRVPAAVDAAVSALSHLGHHLLRVAQLVEQRALLELLVAPRAAQQLIEPRDAAHEEQRVLTRREGVRLHLGLIDPPSLRRDVLGGGPASGSRRVRRVADDVNQLEAVREFASCGHTHREQEMSTSRWVSTGGPGRSQEAQFSS